MCDQHLVAKQLTNRHRRKLSRGRRDEGRSGNARIAQAPRPAVWLLDGPGLEAAVLEIQLCGGQGLFANLAMNEVIYAEIPD